MIAAERMHPVTLSFAAPQLEHAFAEWFYESNRRYLSWGMAAATIGVVLIGLIERQTLPEEAWRFAWRLRYGAVLPLCLLMWAFVALEPLQPLTRKFQQAGGTVGLVGVFTALGLIGGRVLGPHGLLQGGFFAIGIQVAMLYMYLAARLRFLYAAGACLLVYAVSLPVLMDPALGRHVGPAVIGYCTIANLAGMVGCYIIERSSRRAFLSQQALQRANERVDELLWNALPVSIAERLRGGESSIAERHPEATVVFASVVGVTELVNKSVVEGKGPADGSVTLTGLMAPADFVHVLDDLFRQLDGLCEAHGVEKIKTIGGTFMAVVGAPTQRFNHAEAAAGFALAARDLVEAFAASAGLPLQVRAGLASGPVVGGVIGRRKLAFDIWGDTVNMASRMQSTGAAGQVQVSAATADLLGDAIPLQARGPVQVKGIGEVQTWFLAPRALGEARDG